MSRLVIGHVSDFAGASKYEAALVTRPTNPSVWKAPKTSTTPSRMVLRLPDDESPASHVYASKDETPDDLDFDAASTPRGRVTSTTKRPKGPSVMTRLKEGAHKASTMRYTNPLKARQAHAAAHAAARAFAEGNRHPSEVHGGAVTFSNAVFTPSQSKALISQARATALKHGVESSHGYDGSSFVVTFTPAASTGYVPGVGDVTSGESPVHKLARAVAARIATLSLDDDSTIALTQTSRNPSGIERSSDGYHVLFHGASPDDLRKLRSMMNTLGQQHGGSAWPTTPNPKLPGAGYVAVYATQASAGMAVGIGAGMAAGFALGGPIGAVIGGLAGAFVGAAADDAERSDEHDGQDEHGDDDPIERIHTTGREARTGLDTAKTGLGQGRTVLSAAREEAKKTGASIRHLFQRDGGHPVPRTAASEAARHQDALDFQRELTEPSVKAQRAALAAKGFVSIGRIR